MSFTKLFLFFLLLVLNPSQSYAVENVSVNLYYETLCPYCADFIVNHLAKIFQNGLISIVNVRMVPWGNAWLNSDGSFACQHGTDECLLNTIEACTITIYPDVNQHFTFIHCVERLMLQNKHSKWADCFEMSKLGTVPIDCYNSGYGNQVSSLSILFCSCCFCTASNGRATPDHTSSRIQHKSHTHSSYELEEKDESDGDSALTRAEQVQTQKRIIPEIEDRTCPNRAKAFQP